MGKITFQSGGLVTVNVVIYWLAKYMQFEIAARSSVENPAETVDFRIAVANVEININFEGSRLESRYLAFDVPDAETIGIRVEARFRRTDQTTFAEAESKGTNGLELWQMTPTRVIGQLLHRRNPTLKPCRVRCPGEEWVEGMPGGQTCVNCKTPEGDKFELCC